MELSILYFIVKILAMIASVAIMNSAYVDITFLVISTLSFACVFVLELLLDKILHNKKVILVTISFTIIACFSLGMESYFPLYIIALIHLLDLSFESKMFYYILCVSVLLSLFIFVPNRIMVIFVLVLAAMTLFCRILIKKLEKYYDINEKQKETIVDLNHKVSDVKSLMKTLTYKISSEERNRIAARIHDQLGHGISGSIIMLEASMMIMKDNPEKANSGIQKAITNLRNGVDEIRASLREERVGYQVLGINEITAILEEYKVTYRKNTMLKTSGDLQLISPVIWSCIHENLQECLTNLLKHSNATEFLLNIEVFKKIIKVEYKDNGTLVENFEKGLGLEAIEERIIRAKGRCFFNKGEKGFSVTNIFTY